MTDSTPLSSPLAPLRESLAKLVKGWIDLSNIYDHEIPGMVDRILALLPAPTGVPEGQGGDLLDHAHRICDMRADEIVALQAKVESLEAALNGSQERARMLLDAKNHWADRARAAEAKLRSLSGGDSLRGAVEEIKRSVRAHIDQDTALSPHGPTQSFRAGQIDALDQVLALLDGAGDDCPWEIIDWDGQAALLCPKGKDGSHAQWYDPRAGEKEVDPLPSVSAVGTPSLGSMQATGGITGLDPLPKTVEGRCAPTEPGPTLAEMMAACPVLAALTETHDAALCHFCLAMAPKAPSSAPRGLPEGSPFPRIWIYPETQTCGLGVSTKPIPYAFEYVPAGNPSVTPESTPGARPMKLRALVGGYHTLHFMQHDGEGNSRQIGHAELFYGVGSITQAWMDEIAFRINAFEGAGDSRQAQGGGEA